VQNTFVIPVIRDDLLDRCLETLYERTPSGFYVYVVDQTPHGLEGERLRDAYCDLLILRTPRTKTHRSGNLGFAKAVNLAMAMVQTPYATICNDDVEFIHPKWWPAIMDVFGRVERDRPGRPPVIVNPISVKLPHWAIGNKPGDDHLVMPYQETWSDDDWEFLVGERHVVNERLTIRPRTYADGVEMFCSVVPMDRFRRVGMLNERFYPGGGEDYDFNRRAAVYGYSCVSTTQSWVFHHWGMSRHCVRANVATIDAKLSWNNLGELWGPLRDITGLTPDDLPPLGRRRL
jgi:GT2 family glycosyltransferase